MSSSSSSTTEQIVFTVTGGTVASTTANSVTITPTVSNPTSPVVPPVAPPVVPPVSPPVTTPAGKGAIVPQYNSPGDVSWAQIQAAALAYPAKTVVVIINPDSGPSTKASAPAWIAAMQALQTACPNVRFLAYIDVPSGTTMPQVQSNLNDYAAWYPKGLIWGGFFDDMDWVSAKETPAEIVIVPLIQAAARAIGWAFNVGNPGTKLPSPALGGLFDGWVTYEDDTVPSLSALESNAAGAAPSQLLWMTYDVAAWSETLAGLVGSAQSSGYSYVYVGNTDGGEEGPYDTSQTAAYLMDVLAAL